MSRIGKMPIPLPADVRVEWKDGVLSVKGKNGSLSRKIPPEIQIEIFSDRIEVKKKERSPDAEKLWGTYRAHIANMVQGVSKGFEEVLIVTGPAFKIIPERSGLRMIVGYSHPVFVPFPSGITARAEENRLILSGVDKEMLGKFAADVRAVRPPDPYHGHGIRYAYEVEVRKPKKVVKVA